MELNEAFKTICVWAVIYCGRTLLREWLRKNPANNDRYPGETSSKVDWDMGKWRPTIPSRSRPEARPDPCTMHPITCCYCMSV